MGNIHFRRCKYCSKTYTTTAKYGKVCPRCKKQHKRWKTYN